MNILWVEVSEHSWKGQEETRVEVADEKTGLELGHIRRFLSTLVSALSSHSLFTLSLTRKSVRRPM